MATKKWRLISTIEDNAAMQMAIDEAIVIYRSKNKAPNTLRFYIINPPAITIGHNQKNTNVNSSFSIVRRITGGGSVLHKDDLVYSLIVNENELPDKIIDAYKYLSEGLINGFKLLDIPAEFNKDNKKITSNACYLNKNPYEIVVNQKKISGNAQARIKKVVLQQGTIIIKDNINLLLEELKIKKNSKSSITSIEEIINPISIKKIESAMIKGFKDLLKSKNIELVISPLTLEEKKLAKKLYQQKYNNSIWNDKSA